MKLHIIHKYLWKGLTTLLAVYDGSNNLIQRFEYADGRMPVAVIQGGITYYPAYDQVGSLRVVADASGNVVKRIEYDSFGNIIADSNPSFTIPFGFAGGLHDRDTDLVRFGYRDYDPDTGRWTAKDPIGFSGGDTDLYGYVLNDPINLVDALGLLNWEKVIGGGVAVAGGAISIAAGTTLVAIGAAETATIVNGNVPGLFAGIHTMGLGGVLIGAGATTGWIGIELIREGLIPKDPWTEVKFHSIPKDPWAEVKFHLIPKPSANNKPC